MVDRWTRRGATAPHHLEAPHGLWQVTLPAADGRVELGYAGFDAQGRLPGIPLEVGTFSSAAEAMLAVALYEAGVVPDPVRDMAEAEGFERNGPGWQLALGRDARFVLGLLPDAVAMTFEDGAPHLVGSLGRPRVEGDLTLFPRPPGHEAPEALDVTILLQIVGLRRRRGAAGAGRSVTMAELRRWAGSGS